MIVLNIKNVKLDELENIRDFSYIYNKNKCMIKKCSFLRSNNINEFNKKDVDFIIDKYGIKTIIDLRNKDEVINNPCTINGIKYYNISLFESRKKKKNDSKRQIVSSVPNLYEIYLDMIRNKTAKKQLKKILKIIMNPRNCCILYHCSFGKDRTGLITLLLLSMLDVDIDVIKKDYLYSNKYLDSISLNKYNYYLEKSRDVEYASKMRDIYLVKEEYLDYIINYMIDKSGSINNFIIKEIGINDKKINKFKNNFLISIDK